jgi:hypothetical protein
METTILEFIFQYGAAAETIVANLVAQVEAGKVITLADVTAEFAPLKSYGSYGIAKAGSATAAVAVKPA